MNRWDICTTCMEKEKEQLPAHSCSADKVLWAIKRAKNGHMEWQNPLTLNGATLMSVSEKMRDLTCYNCDFCLEHLMAKQESDSKVSI